MSSGMPRVVLDANVLAPPMLCNLLLRSATLGLFTPRWSEPLLAEVHRTQRTRLPRRYSQSEADAWRALADRWFPESMVALDDSLVARLTNDRKDRHVLAAAILADAPVIVTANLRDFRARDLRPWGVEALHPDVFMLRLHALDPDAVERAVRQMARLETRAQTLSRLSKHVPGLTRKLSDVMR